MKCEVRNVKRENFQTSNFSLQTFSGEWRVKSVIIDQFSEVSEGGAANE